MCRELVLVRVNLSLEMASLILRREVMLAASWRERNVALPLGIARGRENLAARLTGSYCAVSC